LVRSGRKSFFDDRFPTSNMKLAIKNVVRALDKQGMLE